MPFAITTSCCADASCVSVCPVGCIHPAPGEPGFGTSEILHIDPTVCIDCGACADACPVGAIYPVDRLVGADVDYARINADHFARPDRASQNIDPSEPARADNPGRTTPRPPPRGHVAVVGAGASGLYTLKELLARTDARITVIDALPTPGGLIRSGVAADHPATKQIQRTFDIALRHRRVDLVGGVELGRDVTLAELRERFDAVFVATGASAPRSLGVPGEDHPHVLRARDVVAWAGGAPDTTTTVDAAWPTLPEAGGRVVIVGTGNVALDLARLLTLPTAVLGRTDVADRALDALRTRRVREVVVLGRGDRTTAACTQAEFRALQHTPGVEVRVIDADDAWTPLEDGAPPTITMLFGSRVESILGPADPQEHPAQDDESTPPVSERAVLLGRSAPGDERLVLGADLVITSLGQDVAPLDALTLDPVTRAFRHEAGRVTDLPGVYVVGWAKRGAIGGIGANRPCAAETVRSYLEDAPNLPAPTRRAGGLPRLVSARGGDVVTLRGARRIDRAEILAGAATGRPRIKLTSRDELLGAASRRMGRR